MAEAIHLADDGGVKVAAKELETLVNHMYRWHNKNGRMRENILADVGQIYATKVLGTRRKKHEHCQAPKHDTVGEIFPY